MALAALILDIDGTLVDSNDAHARAWVEALDRFGYDVPFERVRRLIGKGGDKLVAELTELDPEEGRGKELRDRAGEIFRARHVSSVRPFPGTRELLERVRADGLDLVVATSASKPDMRIQLDVAKIADLIDEKTSSSDAERSKPDPDIVVAAIERSGHAPDALMMLGDTPYDVEAARRAGLEIVAVRSGGWGDDDLRGATAIYDGPADLLARYENSPIARRR